MLINFKIDIILIRNNNFVPALNIPAKYLEVIIIHGFY